VTAGGGSAADVPEELRDRGLADVDTTRLAKDQTWLLVIFAVKVALGLVAFANKRWLGVLCPAAYAVYFWREMRAEGDDASGEGLEPLKFQPRRATPARWAVIAQTPRHPRHHLRRIATVRPPARIGRTVAGPVLGRGRAAVVTDRHRTARNPQRHHLGPGRQTQLALANTSGAMMIQATIPSGIGLLFTPWKFDAPLLLAGVLTAAVIVYLLWNAAQPQAQTRQADRRGRFYAAFAVGLVFTA
jgi:cation:H+ antiporter